jgi:hypothetical protein
LLDDINASLIPTGFDHEVGSVCRGKTRCSEASALILTRHSGLRDPSCRRNFEGVAPARKLLLGLRLSFPEQRESDGRNSRICLEKRTG